MESQQVTNPIYSTLAVDPDLGELVEYFVQAMPDRIQSLSEAFDNGDMPQLETCAHQLKGSLGSYGFDELTPYAFTLEQAVKSRKPETEIVSALDDLIARCKRVTSEIPVE